MANEALRLIGSGSEVSASGAGDELNLRELWRAIMRRKWALLATILLVTTGAYVHSVRQTPLYTSEALLHVKNRDAQVIEFGGVVEEMIADPATIESEIELLNSRAFHRRIAEQLNLIEDPEFNPSLLQDEQEESWFDYLDPFRYIPAEWLVALRGGDQEQLDPVRASLDPVALKMNDVVSAFGSRVTAEQVGRSYVISLAFTSEEPLKSTQIVNAMADEYLVTQVEAKYQAAQRATEWLGKRIEELRGQVLEAEAKIVEYRTRNNLVATNDSNPAMLQFFQLNTQLALAQAQRAEAEARLSQARGLLNAAGGVQAASLVLNPAKDHAIMSCPAARLWGSCRSPGAVAA